MAEETCPSCGAEDVRFSARRGLHLLRALLGTRKRYCRQCKARWSSRDRRGWSAPLRLAFVFACGGAAWTVSHARLIRREPAPMMIYYRGTGNGGPAPSAAETADGEAPSADGPPAALIERTGGTTAEWLRAHQNGAARGARPRRANGLLARLGLKGRLETLGNLLHLKFGRVEPGQTAQLERELKKDKRQLWNEHGTNFGSKEEAKQAYEQAQQAVKDSKAAKP